MTRTDVMASSRPRTAGETATRRSFSRVRRALLLMPVLAILAVVLAGPATAIAAGESTSGYSTKPEEPKSKGTEPGSGTSPTKEEEKSTPATSKEEPAKSSTSPSTTSKESTKSSTLPFTGLDLRWTFAVGLVLMGAGFSIVVVQRRSSRRGSR